MSTQASEVSARPAKAKRGQAPLRIKARYGSICGNCGKTIIVGETIGRLSRALTRYGDPGWVCLRCQGASVIPDEPTLQNVVARIYLRWACGKPVSLNNAEVRTLATHVLAADPELKPERRCERREVEMGGQPATTSWQSWDQFNTSTAEIVGYMLDAVDFDFSCNLSTDTAREMLAHIADRIVPDVEVLVGQIGALEATTIMDCWDELDWRDPLRRKGKPAFALQHSRTALPKLE